MKSVSYLDIQTLEDRNAEGGGFACARLRSVRGNTDTGVKDGLPGPTHSPLPQQHSEGQAAEAQEDPHLQSKGWDSVGSRAVRSAGAPGDSAPHL